LNVFYPYSPAVPQSVQNALNAETSAAQRGGFPIKVAIIGAPVDLGVIPDLFGKPQKYADFLDQEISFQTKQPLLVVMKDGYGVQGMNAAANAAIASLAKPVSGQPTDLAKAAMKVVPVLARAEGHPLAAVTPTSHTSSSGGSSSTPILAGLIVAAIATAAALLVLRRRQASATRP
jgi:hypothetical protein